MPFFSSLYRRAYCWRCGLTWLMTQRAQTARPVCPSCGHCDTREAEAINA